MQAAQKSCFCDLPEIHDSCDLLADASPVAAVARLWLEEASEEGHQRVKRSDDCSQQEDKLAEHHEECLSGWRVTFQSLVKEQKGLLSHCKDLIVAQMVLQMEHEDLQEKYGKLQEAYDTLDEKYKKLLSQKEENKEKEVAS